MMDFDKAIEEAKADMPPFESWERLPGETGAAFAAFCVFRDFGLERNIRKAAVRYADSSEFGGIGGVGTEQHQGSKPSNSTQAARRYKVWRNWSTQFHWRERAADFDKYAEKLKQTEMRKTIEAQGEMHRKVTGKMLEVVSRKLDTMNPAELSHGSVTEWVLTAIKAEREAAGLVVSNGKMETKQGELNFTSDFEGL